MFTFTRNWFLGFAAAGALALTVASVTAFADELNLGPVVGPNEPILTTVGSKRVIGRAQDFEALRGLKPPVSSLHKPHKRPPALVIRNG